MYNKKLYSNLNPFQIIGFTFEIHILRIYTYKFEIIVTFGYKIFCLKNQVCYACTKTATSCNPFSPLLNYKAAFIVTYIITQIITLGQLYIVTSSQLQCQLLTKSSEKLNKNKRGGSAKPRGTSN